LCKVGSGQTDKRRLRSLLGGGNKTAVNWPLNSTYSVASALQAQASLAAAIEIGLSDIYNACVFRIVFGVFFVLNLILWIKGSSAAVPFGTLVALLALWFGISVPLTFVGAYFGFKKPV